MPSHAPSRRASRSLLLRVITHGCCPAASQAHPIGDTTSCFGNVEGGAAQPGWEEVARPAGAAPGAVCRGLLHPPGHTPLPALLTLGAATTHTSSSVTCSPVFEFLCCHGPCRTGSQYSQLSGWWLTQQPTVWFVERLWCVLLVPVGWAGSGRCAFPLQDCPSIARALFLTCQQLLYHNRFG